MRYLTFFFVFFSSISFAQFDKETTRLDAHTMSPVIFEAIPYWSSDTTSIELVVLYRVSPSFLFFAKTANTQEESYEAKGELIVEIMDSSNVTVGREVRPMRIERISIPAEDAPPSDEIQGIFTFKLKKGFFKIVVEAKDSESGKSFINRDTKVDARTFSASDLNVSRIMFIDTIQSDSSLSDHTIIFPKNHGGNVIIGQSGVCLFQVVTPDTSTDIHLAWRIQSKNEDDDEISQQLQGEQCSQRNGTLAAIENAKRVSFTIIKGSAHSRFVFAPIPTERLDAGTYLLTATVTQGALKSVKEFRYNVIWPLKPRSLSDPKVTVDALKLIATEEEIDQMSAFSSDKSRKALRAFWHKRNPDTTRAYNSVMAEYYRRVDESIKRFSTTDEKDGYRTDRGRIYILFGAPSITNRLLKPNTAPTEIWTYESLKKRFTFRDSKKNGNYILVKTENY
ncbi:MAG: GWxTD domain-containing protein [Bacteroidota bacterium]